MSEHGPFDAADAVRGLRARVADGDVSWLRAELRAGRLDWLGDHLADADRDELARRLETGDVAWVRRVLGGLTVRDPGAATAVRTAAEAPVTLPPPEPADRHRAGWLVRTGAAVTLVALAALGLSLCRGGGGTDATGTTLAAGGADAATATTATTAAAALTADAAATTTSTVAPTTTAVRAPTTTAATATTAANPAAGTTVAGGLAPSTTAAPTLNLLDTATSAGFTTLAQALATAELTGTITGTGPFTVLAPTDAAWAKLPAGTLDALLRDRAALTRALRYHLLNGRVTAAQLTPGPVRTLEGGTVNVAQTGGRLTINDATVTRTDVAATNGVLHVVDTVLLPPDFTVGGSRVVAPPPPVGDVVAVLEADGRFGVLVQALRAAGLATTLQGAGPYTLVAPTDAAFRALPAELVTRLLADRTRLGKVLTYHVIAGRVGAAQLLPGATPTVEGDTLQIAASTTGGVTVDGAAVLTADLAATNGVVHAVDRVLVPASVNLADLGVPLVAPQPITLSVFFDSDSATLKPEARAAIVEAAARIPAGAKVALVGVSDTRGNAEANLKLSGDRARAVQRAFEEAGLKATFVISAKGSEPNDDLAKARRVDITAT